jgi:phage/plasmid-like protein (TIGR03299 family)
MIVSSVGNEADDEIRGATMAHNLAVINGRVAMAYQNATPWHKLGVRMNGNGGTIDVAAALTAANLDWRVALQALYLADAREVPDRFAVVRDIDAAILGTVGPQFELVQNADAFGVLTPAIQDFGLTIEAAGALGNGARTWMLARLPETITPVPGDDINGYVVVVNGHDGTHSFEGVLTPIRVVCQNTLQAAVGLKPNAIENRVFKFPHRKTINDQTKAIGELVKDLTASLRASGETFATLAKRRMSPTEVVAFIEGVLPETKANVEAHKVSELLAKRRATIADLVWSQPGAELAGASADGATAWAAYNAVTYYFDHVRPAEAHSASAVRSANESALFGNYANLKLFALKRAVSLVAAA